MAEALTDSVVAPLPGLATSVDQTTLRLASRIITRQPWSRLSYPSRFQIATFSMGTALPRSTSHAGSLIPLTVCVMDPLPQSPLVLPSTARLALPPWPVLV